MGIIGTITKKSVRNPKSCLKISLLLTPIMLLTNQRIKLILHEGTTKTIKRRTKIKAGEIMFEFPDCVVCHADSFFLNKPIPILSIQDHLLAGNSYFILPLDRIPVPQETGLSRVTLLSAASLCSLGSPNNSPNGTNRPDPVLIKLLNGGDSNGNYNSNCNGSPFQYVKDKDGRVVFIKVVPEFITRVIMSNYGVISANDGNKGVISGNKVICSMPELQKQYDQLVRAKDQAWSPKLETITEHKRNFNKFSPSRIIRLEWRLK